MKEIWKDIKGYEGLYKISNHGRVLFLERKVRTKGRGHKIIPEHYLNGYLTGRNVYYKQVTLINNGKAKCFYIHRLVLLHFYCKPLPGEESFHIDNNPLNNRIDNLKWATHKENMIHSRKKLSLSKQGEKHPKSKVTDLQALEIKRMRKQKIKHKVIAEKFGITVQDSMNIATRYYFHMDKYIK